MGRLQKLRQFGSVAGLFSIACYILLHENQNKIWNLDIVNKLVVQVKTDLKQERVKTLPDGTGTEKLGPSKLQNISDCLCSRKWMYPPTMDLDNEAQFLKTESQFKRLNSSCSDEGTHYQTNQNVITYSMFNPTEPVKNSNRNSPINLRNGLQQNLLMLRKHYPGYSIRVYTSTPLEPNEPFCKLVCENEDVFWCDITKTPSHGDLSQMNFRTWRFLTMGDPTVNIFHSRDLDSLISHRDAAAAQDWLSNSTKAIMVMRDFRPYHNVEILAGMWGANNAKLDIQGENIRNKLIVQSQLSSSQDKGFDQAFLKKEVFYPMAKYILAYDSYSCVKWSKFTEVRPFPVRQTKPETDFVGNAVRFYENRIEPIYWGKQECPLKCRPSYGLDWIYC